MEKNNLEHETVLVKYFSLYIIQVSQIPSHVRPRVIAKQQKLLMNYAALLHFTFAFLLMFR